MNINFQSEYTMLLGIIVSLVITAIPVISYLRKIQQSSNVASSKSDAESLLYVHLKDQLETQRVELDRYREENRRLWEMIRGLEQRLLRVENLELDLTTVRSKLIEKESFIETQHNKIVELQQTITEKNIVIESLENSLRLFNP